MRHAAEKRMPGIEDLESIFPRAVSAIGEKFSRDYVAHEILAHWDRIVGKNMARNVHPIAVRGKTLYLWATSASWQNDTRMNMTVILGKINKEAGGELVTGLRFTRSRRETAAVREGEASAAGRGRDIAAEVRAMPVSESAMRAARERAAAVTDPDMRREVVGAMLAGARLRAWQERQGYHPCASCGAPIAAAERLCYACREKERRACEAAVRDILRNMPWAHMKEMRTLVPGATAAMISEQRAILVQTLARSVSYGDKESRDARTLVMLYAGARPDELTDDLIDRTLYRLFFDLHRPRGTRRPRRYDAIKLRGKSGSKKRQKGED